MKHGFDKIKKIFFCCITIILLSFPRRVNAQVLDGVFIMSSVGSVQGMSNNSMAVTFNSVATCLNVQNGAAVLTGERGNGSFVINCEVNDNFNSLGIQIYPNPVSINSKVKFKNQPPLYDIFSITILNAEGVKLITTKANGREIYQGKQMEFGALGIGTFVIQIESDKYKDALKFIKAN